MKKFTKEILQLQEAGIIDAETADRILAYYQSKEGNSAHRLMMIFGVLGALLVGLGIILLLAHNWDQLSQNSKTIIAFVPLLLGLVACGLSYFQKSAKPVNKEASTAFLTMAIGACISLISQIYHLPGELPIFLYTWSILVLPWVYFMPSSMSSLLYIVGITAASFDIRLSTVYSPWLYVLFLGLILPYYIHLIRTKPRSNFTYFHHWFIAISLTLCWNNIFKNSSDNSIFIAYFTMFGIFVSLSKILFPKDYFQFKNAYALIGILGTFGLILFLSFKYYWEDNNGLHEIDNNPLILVFFLAACGLLGYTIKKWGVHTLSPFAFAFIPMSLLIYLPFASSFAVFGTNAVGLALGLAVLWKGYQADELRTMNLGLLIITALIICRFFDEGMSFTTRGILFLFLGLSFFLVNYFVIKKRKNNEK